MTSLITDSLGSMIYQRLMRNLYSHMAKKLETLLLGKGYVLVEGGAGDYIPDYVIYEISPDFWRHRIKFESPLLDNEQVQESVDYMVSSDGRPQVHIREILFALAEDGIVPVLRRPKLEPTIQAKS